MIEMLGGLPRPKKKILFIGGAVAAVVVLVLAGFLVKGIFFKDQDAQNKETAARVTQKAGAIFLAPNEEPTVVKVEDKEKLKGQAFFDRVENGDYLLIYSKAKLALIYRESSNKVVNAGPVNLPEQNAAPQGTTPAKK